MHRWRTAAALVAILTCLTPAACAGSDDTADPPASTTSTATGSTTTTRVDTPAPVPDGTGDPTAGDCLEPMTQPIATGHQLPAIVSCDAPHGGEIVAVYTIDAGEEPTYPASSYSLKGVDEQVGRCADNASGAGDFREFVGAREFPLTDAQQTSTGVANAYLVSGIQYAAFVPGPAAWDRGDRWFVCAAVLSNSLARPSVYDGSLRNALAEPGAIAEQFTWCKRQESDQRSDFTAVPCTEAHNYEQIIAFDAGDADAPDPGDAALGEISASLCPPLSSQATAGRSDDLDETLGLGWTYPLPSEWANGERTVRCFIVTLDGELTTGSAALGTAEPVS